MKATRAQMGRIFMLRLDEGDIVHRCLEEFAAAEGISHGLCLFVGGLDAASRLVVGPKNGHAAAIEPMSLTLDAVFEAAGVGILAPDTDGNPILHMHASCGRGENSRTGCIRQGAEVWLTGEVILLEITACAALRYCDPATGFQLLDIREVQDVDLT